MIFRTIPVPSATGGREHYKRKAYGYVAQKLVDPDLLPGLLEANTDQRRRFAVVDRQFAGGRVELAFI